MRQRYDQGFKRDDSCEDRDQDHPDPCDCWYFRDVTNVRGVKIDDRYEDGGFEGSKTTTVLPRSLRLCALCHWGGGAGEPGTHIYVSMLLPEVPTILVVCSSSTNLKFQKISPIRTHVYISGSESKKHWPCNRLGRPFRDKRL